MTPRRLTIAGLTLAAVAGAGYAAGVAQPPTPRGYVVMEIEVTDPALYEQYKALAPTAVTQAGGRYLVRAGKLDRVEGAGPAGRVVISEFPSMAAASAFLRSPAYAPAAAIRARAAKSRVYVVEGAAQ